MGYADVNMRNDTADKQGVEAVLNAVEQNAVILTPGYDTTSTFSTICWLKGGRRKTFMCVFLRVISRPPRRT